MASNSVRHISSCDYLLESESDVVHAAVLELLLELVAGILEALTSGLNVVYTNTDMAEAFSRLLVSVRDFEIRIVLGS